MENKRRKSLTKRDLDLDAMASISEKIASQEATETKDDEIATDTESRRIIRTGSRTGSGTGSGDDRLEDLENVDRESEVQEEQEVEGETRTTNQRRVQERIVTGKIQSYSLKIRCFLFSLSNELFEIIYFVFQKEVRPSYA